ncbi:MAG: GAF and ANTAR domain-containing protein [Candidatus Omnitrophica bacterium]|nr:GAF and ANTAR domain-containing protein [Candidatus Omnitrophota bacterium]
MSEKHKSLTEESASSKQAIGALTKISEAITSDLYLEDILKLIVSVTAETMGSKICSLMLLDSSREELEVKATQSVSEAYNKKPNIKVGIGIAGKVFKEAKPITVSDVRKDVRYLNRDIAKKERLCSLLSVPLVFKGKAIGVLNSYTSSPHKFSKNEINILRSIANQAAVVIENFRLVVETKVIKEELESRKAVERAKGILMKQQGLSEQEAYQRIRKYSMDNRKSMREVSEAIILSEDLHKE